MSVFSAFDTACMERALQLAALGKASTQPNPRVGCVLARDARIIGEGWHRAAGEPHAEAHALLAAGALARGSTAYVTLEPCNHHGRTPPCSESLIEAGVVRVVYAVDDPDPRVRGAGARRLAAAGVAVERGLCGDAARELNIGYLMRVERGRPWLRLKLAASLDGRTALAGGESQWITSEAARADVQRWRAESAAILTTAATVLADDPLLNVRLPEVTRQPARLLLDRAGRIPSTARLWSSGGYCYVLSGPGAARPTAAVTGPTVTTQTVGVLPDGHLDLHAVLSHAAAWRLNEVWVEAGATLAGALLDAGCVDELVLYLAPSLLGPDARPLARVAPLQRLADRRAWRVTDLRQIGPDVRIMLRS